MKDKLKFITNYVMAFPKIAYRYYLSKKKNTNFAFYEFRPINLICINGSLNRLVWTVENFIYLTVSNSSEIYFDSGEYIFKCEGDKTDFILKVRTINGTKKITTSIKVINLITKEFHPMIYRKSNSLNIKTNTIKIKRKIQDKLKEKLECNQIIKSNELVINQDFQNVSIMLNDKKNITLVTKIQKTKPCDELESLKEKI